MPDRTGPVKGSHRRRAANPTKGSGSFRNRRDGEVIQRGPSLVSAPVDRGAFHLDRFPDRDPVDSGSGGICGDEAGKGAFVRPFLREGDKIGIPQDRRADRLGEKIPVRDTALVGIEVVVTTR